MPASRPQQPRQPRLPVKARRSVRKVGSVAGFVIGLAIAAVAAVVVAVVVVAAAGAQAPIAQALIAQAPEAQALPNQAPESDAPLVAVLRGPGEIGYWLVTADGQVSVVGTSIVPTLDRPLVEEGADARGPVVGARIGAPGALGIWLQHSDGSEVAVGDPGPNVDNSDDRPTGWLVGIATRQLMRGAWWPDIDLACTAELPTSVQVGQTVMASLSEANFGAAVVQARAHLIGGILLEGTATPHIWRRIAELQEISGRLPLMFAVDEEGGSVQRLRGVLPQLGSAASQTNLTPAEVTEAARQHALAMAELGFNANFAPVLDVGAGPGIGSRSFSDDPSVVTEYGVATINGISDGGVLAVAKHFPGHGGASADTHRQLATTDSIAALRTRDLAPFTAAIGTNRVAVMVGHLVVPDLTNGLPASLSPEAIKGLLREELGHGGLVVTDSLTMRAIADRWSVAEAARLSLVAGVDLALVGGLSDAKAAHSEITAAVRSGEISQERLSEAATNVLRAKGVYACELVGRLS